MTKKYGGSKISSPDLGNSCKFQNGFPGEHATALQALSPLAAQEKIGSFVSCCQLAAEPLAPVPWRIRGQIICAGIPEIARVRAMTRPQRGAVAWWMEFRVQIEVKCDRLGRTFRQRCPATPLRGPSWEAGKQPALNQRCDLKEEIRRLGWELEFGRRLPSSLCWPPDSPRINHFRTEWRLGVVRPDCPTLERPPWALRSFLCLPRRCLR